MRIVNLNMKTHTIINKSIRLYSVVYKEKLGITYPALVQEAIASGGMSWLDITWNTVRFQDNFKTTKLSSSGFG